MRRGALAMAAAATAAATAAAAAVDGRRETVVVHGGQFRRTEVAVERWDGGMVVVGRRHGMVVPWL